MELDKFIEEIEYLKEAEELLNKIYTSIGVYNLEILDGKFDYPKPLSIMIKNHFKFDDSE